jgi:hypothetical protein
MELPSTHFYLRFATLFMGIPFTSMLTHFPLSGPLHGGANEAVIRMLISIGRSGFIANIFVVFSFLY